MEKQGDGAEARAHIQPLENDGDISSKDLTSCENARPF